MDRIIRWYGTNTCDLCKSRCIDKIYDAQVGTFQGNTWASVCEACYTAYGVGKAEPFVWSDEQQGFIKIKHVSDKARLLSDTLGLDQSDIDNLLEDIGL